MYLGAGENWTFSAARGFAYFFPSFSGRQFFLLVERYLLPPICFCDGVLFFLDSSSSGDVPGLFCTYFDSIVGHFTRTVPY